MRSKQACREYFTAAALKKHEAALRRRWKDMARCGRMLVYAVLWDGACMGEIEMCHVTRTDYTDPDVWLVCDSPHDEFLSEQVFLTVEDALKAFDFYRQREILRANEALAYFSALKAKIVTRDPRGETTTIREAD
jgi:hypothetical protein